MGNTIILADDPSIRDDLKELLAEEDYEGARILLDMAYEEDICCRIQTQLDPPKPRRSKIKNRLEARRRAFKAHEKEVRITVLVEPTPKGQLIMALKDAKLGDPQAQVESLTRIIQIQDHRKGLAVAYRERVLKEGKGIPVGVMRELVNG